MLAPSVQRARGHVGRNGAQHAQDTQQAAPTPTTAQQVGRPLPGWSAEDAAEQSTMSSSPALVPATPSGAQQDQGMNEDGAATPMTEELRDHIQVRGKDPSL